MNLPPAKLHWSPRNKAVGGRGWGEPPRLSLLDMFTGQDTGAGSTHFSEEEAEARGGQHRARHSQ